MGVQGKVRGSQILSSKDHRLKKRACRFTIEGEEVLRESIGAGCPREAPAEILVKTTVIQLISQLSSQKKRPSGEGT